MTHTSCERTRQILVTNARQKRNRAEHKKQQRDSRSGEENKRSNKRYMRSCGQIVR